MMPVSKKFFKMFKKLDVKDMLGVVHVNLSISFVACGCD